MAASHPLDNFLLQRMRDGNISSTALVVTFFCDVVTQHGGEIWLGSIIRALTPLGINERLTRTSVYRLVQDGWLESRKQGRRSYYRLTQTGQNYYQRAAQRIYTCAHAEWDGDWSVLFISLVPDDRRDSLKRGLSWLGYGQMAPGVYALPSNQPLTLNELLQDLGLRDHVVQMQARAQDTESLKELVLSRWKLDELQELYKDFISLYLKAGKALHAQKSIDGHSKLLLRILLIHEYRRILLKDPELPVEMLPENWEGHIARSLTAQIYRELVNQTTNWVGQELLDDSCHVQSPGEPSRRFE
jgi:phenylacetic acid degradation operon negative regulatory protein